MAVITFMNSGVKFVAEKCRPCLRDIVSNLFGCDVATTTIPFYRKSQKCIMAGATGPVLLHFRHGIAPVSVVSSKECIMTVTAAVHFKVPQMGEQSVSPEVNILYGVALAAILGN